MSRQALKSEVREAVKNRFGGKCGYCGELPAKLHIDHVKAVRDGGTNDPANLMPACPSCNNYKMSWSLSFFRSNLADQVNRCRQYSVNYRLAERFGLVKAEEKPVVFYFEKEKSPNGDEK